MTNIKFGIRILDFDILVSMFIICGLGHNSLAEDKIRKILLAGADMLRYNLTYRTLDENITHIQTAQKVIDELSVGGPVKIIIDLPNNKVRLGSFDCRSYVIREMDELVFKNSPSTPNCSEFIPVNFPGLGKNVKVNQTITIGDGEVALQVVEIIDEESIKVKVLNNGIIRYFKSFNCGLRKEDENFFSQVLEILEKTAELKVDFIAVPYLNGDIYQKLRNSISDIQKRARVIVKIESEGGLSDLEQICNDPGCDMILMDRGELGVNIPYEQLGVWQKKVARLANLHKKPLIISSHILESTANNYIPYRSEIFNLTQMVLDGVDGILLTQETTTGKRPAYSISVAKKIIDAAQKFKKESLK